MLWAVRFILDFRLRLQDLLFGTRDGRKLARNNMLRDVKRLCTRLGFNRPRRTVHATRHAFSTEYLRRGGSPFHLQKTLGQTSLEMLTTKESPLLSQTFDYHFSVVAGARK
jgi:integrase/recombinase XerD